MSDEIDIRQWLMQAARGAPGASWHQAGNLGPPAIDYMWHLTGTHFPNGITASVETGCGLSTVLLAHRSKRHICFTLGTGDNSYETVRSKLPEGAPVEFVLGPSQLTLQSFKPGEKIDFALIDGAHAYPIPDLDYWHIYPHLSAWGILVIDDIHIPTIGNLVAFLKEDAMFHLLATVETTAFFMRTDVQTHDPLWDGWHLQKYNASRLREFLAAAGY